MLKICNIPKINFSLFYELKKVPLSNIIYFKIQLKHTQVYIHIKILTKKIK